MKRHILLSLLALAAVACGPGTRLSGEATETTETTETTEVEPVAPPKAEPLTRVELSDAEKARVESSNAFAFRLLKTIGTRQEKSVFLSPLSVQYALGMVNNAASGETEKQITSVLGQSGRDELNDFSRHLLSDLPRVDTSVTLSLANGILVNDQYTLKAPFKETVEKFYDAKVERMSYADSKAVVARVNAWCAEKTRGMIREILSEVNPDAILFALNAIYFKGNWAKPFEKRYTRKEDFKTLSGKVVQADMMHRTDHYGYAENDVFQRLSMSYGNGRYVLEAYLPKQDIPTLLSHLAETPWKVLSSGRSSEVIVSFPKFSTESFLNLNGTLSALGMPRAFTNAAEFYGLVEEEGAKISRVLHKARIELDETGTEAAAVTAVEMMRLTSVANPPRPKEFRADRPFVYLIAERSSGAILFTGVYTGE